MIAESFPSAPFSPFVVARATTKGVDWWGMFDGRIGNAAIIVLHDVAQASDGDPRQDCQRTGEGKEIGGMQLDIDAIRAQIRAMDFERGTSDQIAQWREDDRDSRHNLVIEGMCPEPVEDALFAMLLDEGVPPALASTLVVDVIRTDTGKLAA